MQSKLTVMLSYKRTKRIPIHFPRQFAHVLKALFAKSLFFKFLTHFRATRHCYNCCLYFGAFSLLSAKKGSLVSGSCCMFHSKRKQTSKIRQTATFFFSKMSPPTSGRFEASPTSTGTVPKSNARLNGGRRSADAAVPEPSHNLERLLREHHARLSALQRHQHQQQQPQPQLRPPEELFSGLFSNHLRTPEVKY